MGVGGGGGQVVGFSDKQRSPAPVPDCLSSMCLSIFHTQNGCTLTHMQVSWLGHAYPLRRKWGYAQACTAAAVVLR